MAPTKIIPHSSTGILNVKNDSLCQVIYNCLSDHSCQILTIKYEVQNNKDGYVPTRLFSESNYYKTCLRHLSKETRTDIYKYSTVNKGSELFTDTVKFYIDLAFP